MSIFEYDEEKHLINEREYAYNQGLVQGEKSASSEENKKPK